MNGLDGHVCTPPLADRRKHWWTCETCGQPWRRVDGRWCLTPREPDP